MSIRISSRHGKVISAVLGIIFAFDAAYAASNWTVGLTAGSTGGQAQAASVQNLTITTVATPGATNLLYPGGTGDVVASITNPNPFPVTITAVQLPANTSYAAGYSDSALTSAVAGCAAGTPSGVTWNFATGSSGTSHTLTSAVTVAASGSLVVTFANDASMALTAPAACEALYFSMPSFTGVTATGGAGTATTSPAADAWTS